MNAPDLFALARQDDAKLRPGEQELLQAYRVLTPKWADAAVRMLAALGRELERDTADHKPIKPPRNMHDTDRLRAAAEELAAAYRAPLPEGDAGLIAAVQRWRDLEPRHSFQGLAGAAAKLRYCIENGACVDLEDIGGEQLVEIIEREAERAI